MTPYQAHLFQYSIVDFEFSWKGARAGIIMATWGDQGLKSSIKVNSYDFIFMVGYGGFLWGIAILVGRKVSSLSDNPKLNKRSGTIGIISLLALFLMKRECKLANNPLNPSNVNASISSMCALLKFSAIALSILYSSMYFVKIVHISLFQIKKT